LKEARMAQGWVHTVRHGRDWATEIEGQGPVLRHETRSAALEAGTDAARRLGTRHVIHGEDGAVVQIVDRQDLGDDFDDSTVSSRSARPEGGLPLW
jgi:hypothetical protein